MLEEKKMPRIIFRDINPAVAEAVRAEFADVAEFDVETGDIFSYGDADAIVSPGNSAGSMDGGFDRVYMDRFGAQIQTFLMERIRQVPGGFLPIGAALALPTGYPSIPMMIAAPTMARPMAVADTQNAFLAFSAVLNCALGMGFRVVLCPGLATLTGRMDHAESARQMRVAWDDRVSSLKAEASGPLSPEQLVDHLRHLAMMEARSGIAGADAKWAATLDLVEKLRLDGGHVCTAVDAFVTSLNTVAKAEADDTDTAAAKDILEWAIEVRSEQLIGLTDAVHDFRRRAGLLGAVTAANEIRHG